MQRAKSTIAPRLIAVGCAVVFAVWLLWGGLASMESRQKSNQYPNVAGVPQQPASLPSPQPTDQPPLPIVTPTFLVPTVTPAPAVLQPAVVIRPNVVSQVKPGLDISLTVKSAINSTEPMYSMTWAPTGDKILYVTASGKLYVANLDGGDATLLTSYDRDALWGLLDDQMPKGNTLFVRRSSSAQGQQRGPGGLDLLRFAHGQRPVREEVQSAEAVFNIHWWKPDRVSGTRVGESVGGDKLITLSSNGRLVEERNVPYMQSGVVRPGGDWLAYVTSQQTTDTPFYGSDPETAYLLNLSTGQRLQISPSGKARNVHNWSPDGSWVLIDAYINDTCGTALVSANGQEVITIAEGCGQYLYDAVWNPNSKRLAFSNQFGGCDAESQTPCAPPISKVYIADIADRKITQVDASKFHNNSTGLAMQPKWSPDGSSLALLSFDPKCPFGTCSAQTPALLLLEVK